MGHTLLTSVHFAEAKRLLCVKSSVLQRRTAHSKIIGIHCSKECLWGGANLRNPGKTNKNKTTTAVPGKKCENAGENKKSTSAWEPFSWIPQGCARFYIGHAARPPPPLLDWMLASSVQPAHRCQHPEARSSISKAQSVSKKKESVSKKKESVSKKKEVCL